MTEKNLIVYIEEPMKTQRIGVGDENSAQALKRIAKNLGIEFASVTSVGAVTQEQYDRMTMLVTDAKPQIDSGGAKPLLELIDRRQQQQFMAEVLSSAVMGTGVPTLVIDPRSDLKNSPAIWRVDSIDESAAKQISQAILDYKAGWGMTLATLKSTREFDVSRDGQKR